ncbi:hypothetical protein [Tenacibaculum sp. 190524A02b]|uniref:hypothetical protein n=1 Tax=Tenacibaculum vairaonense TaxID=3137860 RepID=UPI0031FB6029
MKYLLKIIIVILFLGTQSIFSQDKNITGFDEIIYRASTRGTSIMVKVHPNKVQFKNNEKDNEFKISNYNQKKIVNLLNKLNLKEIHNLKAPTNNRASDKSLHATITINTNGKTYKSATFDADNPPKELKSLLKEVCSLGKPE